MTLYHAHADFAKVIVGIEKGRIVNRDTCASDPQVMAPPQVEQYYKKFFTATGPVKIIYNTLNNKTAYETWPLCEAVNRAVNGRFMVK